MTPSQTESSAKRYPCPCCGYTTLEEKPPGTYLICPVCFWEDTATDREWGSNGVSIREGQRNFMAFGACAEEWRDDVRPPTENEQRSPDWQSFEMLAEAAKDRAIAQITAAFAGVTRDDGVSLHEARAIDDYGGEAERAAARAKDTESQWEDVPDESIEYFSDVLSFFDPKGFRYYIPAYMIWSLKHYMTSNSLSSDSTIYAFNIYKGLEDYALSRFQLLDRNQCIGVCQFLRFMATHGEGYVDTYMAREALQKHWGKFCESEA